VPTNNAETVREFYRRQGEERERERIIAQLEIFQTLNGDNLRYFDVLIAQIKKEKINDQI